MKMELDSEEAMSDLANDASDQMTRATDSSVAPRATVFVPESKERVGKRLAQARADQLAQAWFTMVRYRWDSLVLVPVDDSISALEMAGWFAEVGRRYHRTAVEVVDATALGAKDLDALLPEIELLARRGGRALIAVPPPLTHHDAVPIARAADAAVLLARLGHSKLSTARQTIECVGSGSFVGSFALHC